MSWTTLPWLPLAFGGSLLTFREKGCTPYIMMSSGLGLLWWGHSPIAIWSTVAIGLTQLARFILTRPRLLDWRDIGLGCSIFCLLIAYPIVSVLGVPIDPSLSTTNYAAPKISAIQESLNISFPGVLFPLNSKNPALAFFQPGWSLVAIIAFCLYKGFRERIRNLGFWTMLITPLILLFLLIPIPHVSTWNAVPALLRNPTGSWPMQRFYVIIAICSVCALASLIINSKPSISRTAGLLLIPTLLWSFYESRVIIAPKEKLRQEVQQRSFQRLPENNILTRNAYLVFTQPPAYFSHSYIEHLLENRLLQKNTYIQLLGNNEAAILPQYSAKLLQEGSLNGTRTSLLEPWSLSPTFKMEPERRYALQLEFTQPGAEGILIIDGQRLNRVYGLPTYGGSRSFGSTAISSKLISLSTSGSLSENITLRFFAQRKSLNEDFHVFANYRWFSIDMTALPIKVTNWIPYKARVQSPVEAWLETPRMFQPGYQATVDGKTTIVAKSPEGLVMVPVPPGASEVTLAYRAPYILLVSYWISLGAILALTAVLARAIFLNIRKGSIYSTVPSTASSTSF